MLSPTSLRHVAFRLLLACSLAGVTGARAETIPATQDLSARVIVWSAAIENFTGANHSQDGRNYPSCSAAGGAVVGVNPCEAANVFCGNPQGRCKVGGVWRSISIGGGGLGCLDGTTWNGSSCWKWVCPTGQNWTLSGSTCTRPDCVAPEVRDPATGQCVIKCPTDQVWSAGTSQCLCSL